MSSDLNIYSKNNQKKKKWHQCYINGAVVENWICFICYCCSWWSLLGYSCYSIWKKKYLQKIKEKKSKRIRSSIFFCISSYFDTVFCAIAYCIYDHTCTRNNSRHTYINIYIMKWLHIFFFFFSWTN